MCLYLLIRCSQRPEDLEELVDLRVAREQGPIHHNLSEDAADRPHVNGRRVLLQTEAEPQAISQKMPVNHAWGVLVFLQDLWGAGPERNDLVGVRAYRDTKRASQPEVGKLESARAIDEEILWFHVAVEDAAGVAEVQAVEHLEHVALTETQVLGVSHAQRRLWRVATRNAPLRVALHVRGAP